MVERRFPKPDVEGSSPSGRACSKYPAIIDIYTESPLLFFLIIVTIVFVIPFYGEVAEWFKASDC